MGLTTVDADGGQEIRMWASQFTNLDSLRHNSDFNSVPNNKLLDFYKLKAFADDKIQNKCNPNIKTCFEKDRKHCWKRRKCWLPAFSLPTLFSKDFFLRVI